MVFHLFFRYFFYNLYKTANLANRTKYGKSQHFRRKIKMISILFAAMAVSCKVPEKPVKK